ncbi:MAG: DOMON domain-containing protein, partial [Hyphococcus sp.]
AYDTEPHLIRRSQLQRDLQLRDDDGVRVLIDPFGTFRNSFIFGVNPNGARADGLTQNNNQFLGEWDGVWNADAKVVDDGWTMEFSIPFQTISFDPSLDEWNFQIIRVVRRTNEEIRWSNINQNLRRIDMTNPGRLGGLESISSGVGLEVQAFLAGSTFYDWETGDADFAFNPSGNAFYKITDSLTGSVTVNTDFSDAPLDARQVNTGRFSLFFPETRDFFLQDVSVFEFGGRNFRDFNNGLPFFSRNIGIVNGAPVDILAGAKLSGKIGPASVGLISTQTAEAEALGIDGQLLSSGRVSIPVLEESKAGLVFSNGDPSGETENTVAGADFQFQRSNVFGEGILFADLAYVRSITDGVHDDLAAGEIAFRSQKWNGTFTIRDIGENYAPQLGFVNRTGIRRYRQNVFRRFRPQGSVIRTFEFGSFSSLITDLDDIRTDHAYGAWTEWQTNDGDEFSARYRRSYERIREPFEIAGVVPVNPGEYRWEQYEVTFQTTSARTFGVGVGVNWGGVYDGDTTQISSNISFRPSKYFELTAEHEYLDFDLPTGEIGVHIGSVNSTIAFSPRIAINTEIQYDNISESLAFFSRFRWEPVPEREIFFSIGHSAMIERDTFPREFVSQGSSFALRLGHIFRL